MPLLHASWSIRQSANMYKESAVGGHELDMGREQSVQGGCGGSSISPKDNSLPLSKYREESSELRGLNVDRDILIGRIKKEQSPIWVPSSSVSLQNISIKASTKAYLEIRTKQL